MMKTKLALLFIVIAHNAIAQDGARNAGNHLGKFIAGFLIVFLLIRFVIKPLLQKNKK